ncbi:MAG: choice-of-anchor E domain-containing protein [Moorea sp. SIO1G6]|uniref:choice-of-anchor E domain-containing protein n=1 Tax=Moorena sp. SIO1G6 TaxID=2607840 RepID=UPI0013BFD01C|nr:choice-of-anchor E domain-containing protein [Moorena sp. SIO1G6]NES82407.1 choice-of-anchor E domain-containing protein [Moorena sp. SIO2B7]NET63987.1 choice-of-anchor E domain-containing protein [Moorena sp. SIO1G6]
MKSLFNYLQGIRYHSSDSSGASEVNSDWQPLGFNLMGITNLAKATFPILVTGSALLVSTPTEVAGQVGIDASLATGPRPFSLRYSAHVPGNMVAIGNASLICDRTNASCLNGLATGNVGNNSGGLAMQMLDSDSDPSTFNSSSADLTLPVGANVLFAGLYWGGTSDGATTPAPDASKRNEALLATPEGGYQTVTADTFTSIDNSATSGWDVYSSFADVTSLVQAAGSGTYTLANVQASTGTGFTYPNAGWSLIVVYEDPSEPRRNMTVFDGYDFSGFNTGNTQTLTGLRTPPTPGFSVFMGAFAGDGEPDVSGDTLSINNTPVSDPVNPLNNFYNSTISQYGSHVTSRTPNDPYNMVVDIDLLDLTAWNEANNVIPTNATSIDLNLSTSGDGIWPMVYFFGVEVFEPNLVTEFEKTTPQTTYQNGDTIGYTISVTNTGNDNAVNTVITDIIPTGTTFVPGSLKINGVTKTDGATDEAEFDGTNVIFRVGTGANTTQGGQLNVNETVTMSFEVTVTAAPGEKVCNQASIDYEGEASGNQASGTSDDPNTATFGDCTEITVTPPTTTVDYGDAPDTTASTGNGDYQTLSANSGPTHTIDNSTYLGAGVTADTDGFGDGTDNNNNATDDTDDGVQINSASLQGQTLPISDNVRLDITTAGSGVLNAWIDWNADGDFDDSGEQIATNASPSGNAIALNLTVPAGATVGNTYARFRYSSDTGLTPTGAASDGEVEDYQIAIANSTPTTASVGDQVWEDLDGDGIQDPGEPGIPNALVNIYKSDNTLVDATFTDSSGNYSFSDLDPGDYIIEFTSPAVGYSFTRQDAGDDTLDSDADPVTGRTDTFTLAAGDNNTSIDAGLTLKANTIVACDIIPLQATNWTETLNVEKFDSALGSLARVDLTLSTLIAQELIYENTADQPKTITVNQEGEVSVSLPDTNANITRNYNQSTDFNLPAFDGSDPPDFSGTSGGRTPTILAYETHTEEYTNLADFISSSSPVETVSIPVNTTSAATFINSQNASTGSSSEATAGLCVTYTYSLVPKEPSASIVPEEASPEAGNIVINEVLYAQTGSSAEANDEFIELYNSSDNAVDISNWKLADSNLIFNSTDNTGNITGDAANPAYIFPNNTTLQPGEYAVIWIGNNTSDHQAPDAAFQDWLGKAAKLNNAGEDIWLYDEEFKIVDYIAYGSNNAINTPPSAELNLWDDTYQRDLDGASTGQSISLTPNGEDGNTSACWEHTLSNDANGRCPEFLETRDTDTVSVRQTSVGVYNNILPNVILVKRITAIKPKDTNQWIELPQSGSPFIDGIDGGSSENNVGSDRAADDNDPNWPNPDVYLRGLINSGQVMPGDELEYTVYFLSNGSNDAKNLRICDRVPGETTFITDSFNATAGFPSSDVGIAMFQSTTTLASGGPAEPNIYLTNIPDSDRGRYYGPGTSVPSGCNVTFNQNGVVVVEVGDVPNADSPGNPPNSYGFIRFRALVK